MAQVKTSKKQVKEIGNNSIKVDGKIIEVDTSWESDYKEAKYTRVETEEIVIKDIKKQLKTYKIKIDYFLDDLIKKYAFLKITLIDMEEAVRIGGVIYYNNKGNPKKNPVLAELKNYLKTFNDLIKTFNDIILKKLGNKNNNRVDSDVTNLMDFIKK